jgi:hypothetical protein
MGTSDGVMVKRRRRKMGAGVVRVRRQRPTVEPLHKTAPGYFRRPARNQRSEQFSVALSAFEGATWRSPRSLVLQLSRKPGRTDYTNCDWFHAEQVRPPD